MVRSLSAVAGRVGLIVIVRKNVARAQDIYRDTLGVKHLFDADPTEQQGGAERGATLKPLSGSPSNQFTHDVLHFPPIEAEQAEEDQGGNEW